MRMRYVEPGIEPPPELQLPRWREGERGWVQTALVRREVFDRIGLLDENVSFCDDVEWVLRATRLGVQHEVMTDLVFGYRFHGQNITSDRAALRRAVFALLRSQIAANPSTED